MSDELVLAPDAIPSVQPPVAVTPGALLQSAVAAGLGVEGIRALAEIYEREQVRAAVQSFNRALAALQAEVPTIGKTRKADRYSYAPFDQVAAELREPLQRHGFSYTFDSELKDHAVEVTMILRHRDGHSERTRFSAPVDAQMRVNETQKVGSALSYGKRYALMAGLGLSTGDADDDGGRLSGKVTEAQLTELARLLSLARPDNMPAFWRFAKVDALEDLPARDYERVRAALEQKAGPRA